MKIFISADIEGVTGVNSWSETELSSSEHKVFAEQMTEEVVAACEGAVAMGAKEIFIKDAHGSARNIDMRKLPKCARLSRGWTYCPDCMVAGLDESFDAAIFIGYHSAAGYNGNQLAHTMSLKVNYIKINGQIASEYVLNSYIASGYGVPVVFLSGDKMLCERAKDLNSSIETVAVNEGVGGATISINPELSCELIKEGVKKSLKHISSCKLKIPEKFDVEVNYKEHKDAKRTSYYPGVTQISTHTVIFTAKSINELKTALMFIL